GLRPAADRAGIRGSRAGARRPQAVERAERGRGAGAGNGRSTGGPRLVRPRAAPGHGDPRRALGRGSERRSPDARGAAGPAPSGPGLRPARGLLSEVDPRSAHRGRHSYRTPAQLRRRRACGLGAPPAAAHVQRLERGWALRLQPRQQASLEHDAPSGRRGRRMSHGPLSIVLHAHLPYVRHPEYPEFLEEDWLYEAITETYLPLLEVFDRCVDEGGPFRVTMTLTPPLVGMLRDELLMSRYAARLDKLCELSDKEVHRTRTDATFGPLAWHYRERHFHLPRLLHDRYKRDLVLAFKRL